MVTRVKVTYIILSFMINCNLFFDRLDKIKFPINLIMSSTTKSIDLRGSYSWELVFDIDNTANDGEIRRVETIKSSLSVSWSNLVLSIQQYVMENKISFSSEVGTTSPN